MHAEPRRFSRTPRPNSMSMSRTHENRGETEQDVRASKKWLLIILSPWTVDQSESVSVCTSAINELETI